MTRTGPVERLKGLYPLTIIIAVLALSLQASPALAVVGGNCLQDEFSKTAKQTLGCTANDVRVAKVINIRDLNGATLTSCVAGSTFNFIADFLVQTSSRSSRSNIGLYFGTAGGQTNALKGSCSDNIIPPSHTCPGSNNVTCGSSNYDELDPSPDNCGDSSSSDPTVCLDASGSVVNCPAPAGGTTLSGTQIVTIEVDNFSCTAPAGTTQLVLPNCTSWQVPGSATLCEAASPDYPYPFTTTTPPLPEAIPGSPSKCNCSTIPLGITVQSPAASVTKSCTVGGDTPSTNSTSCNLTPEGGQVTYTVDVTNNSNFGDIVVDQICDSAYGTIFQAAGFGGPACPAGSTGSSSTGGTCALGLTVAQGIDQPCTFTASQPEATTVTDTVSINGHGSLAGTFGPTTSNSVVVTSNEAPSTATTTKSLFSTTAGCATVRYDVDVHNTSSGDEVLTLSGLTDNQVDITKLQSGNILGTTCGAGLNGNGLGTLNGSPAAGALSTQLAIDGHYTCQFDAQFCGTLVDGCIQHTDSVVPALADDDSEGNVPSNSSNTLTVKECFTSSFTSSP